MTSALFSPIAVGPLTLKHRLWVAPMCQYSVSKRDGVPNDWHLVHYGTLASSGAALVLTEATAISPEGRISPQDTGIWNDEQVEAWSRITAFEKERGAVPGIQLQHAGRKASTYAGWGFEGKDGTVPAEEGGWRALGPSPVAFGGYDVPEELDLAGIEKIVSDFGAAARHAIRAGFQVLELHAAHGYLLHQFLSPASNHRTDPYGGSLENRARLLLRAVQAVKDAAGDAAAVIVRFSATDWLPAGEPGWTQADTATVAGWAKQAGADFFDISTGGNVSGVTIPVGPGYQVPFAAYVRSLGEVPTAAVGVITSAEQAEQIVVTGQADAVLIAREVLRDPRAPIRWARELGAEDASLWQPQDIRARR